MVDISEQPSGVNQPGATAVLKIHSYPCTCAEILMQIINVLILLKFNSAAIETIHDQNDKLQFYSFTCLTENQSSQFIQIPCS